MTTDHTDCQKLETEVSRIENMTKLAKLREQFEPHQISKLCRPYKKDSPKGRCAVCGGYHGMPAVTLDYVGHAATTDRLLSVDPLWSWKPVAFDSQGLPLLDREGGLWIRLTVLGMTRLGYGDAQGKTGGDAMKERIGDAIRNAAMRFGVALDLWHKGDLHLDEDAKPAGKKNGRETKRPGDANPPEAPEPPPQDPSEPVMWSDEDVQRGVEELMTARDTLISAGATEDEAMELTNSYRAQFHDIDFERWQNRLFAAIGRACDKLNGKLPVLEGMSDADLKALVVENWFKLRERWQAEGLHEAHIKNRAKSRITEWAFDAVKDTRAHTLKVAQGQTRELEDGPRDGN